VNNGKICVSVCAETADEIIAHIKQAESLADLIEVRFDCLPKHEFDREKPEESDQVLYKLFKHHDEVPWISTFRTKEQGGRRELSNVERENFWNSGFETEICDVEEDIVEDSWYWLWDKRICSYHDFSGTPPDVAVIFERLSNAACEKIGGGPEIVKIAVQAEDVTDAIPIWKLIEQSRAIGNHVIPIAMGEAGKWTRILGLAHGSYLTYASLSEGQETADGQITAKDLIEVYRVKELDLDTKVYGVIGDPVSESLSPHMHNAAFIEQNINAVFIPLQVKDLDGFIRRMVRAETREVELNFGGFAVTMPHKQTIIKHLDEIDPTAEKIGAVNTVKIDDGKLIGYNTDAYGFITPLKERFGDLKDARVAVFGAGGAARACVYVLREENADVKLFVRDIQKAKVFANDLGVGISEISNFKFQISDRNFDIIVNATPLGMKGSLENESIFTAEQLKGVKFVYDLVTRGDDTPLIRVAKKADVTAINGTDMLVQQGAKQFEIWTGQDAPIEKMRDAIQKKIR